MKLAWAFVLALVLCPAAAMAAGDQDFTLVNGTGIVIDKVFVSPHDQDKWGDDVLGRDVLGDNEACEIKFHRDEEAADWDLKIVDREGNQIEWEGLHLPTIHKVTLKYEDKKATAEIE